MSDQEKARAGMTDTGLGNELHGQGSDAQTNAQARIQNPNGCPRFEHCSAPICPLDPDWRKRSHLRRDPVCLYLREAVKPDAEANLAGHLPRATIESVLILAPTIAARHGDIRRRLAKAAQASSKLASSRRLAPAGQAGHG